MTPIEKLHEHHEKLIGTIRELASRTEMDPADASLLLSYCSEYLISHAEAEEVTLYKADGDVEFINNMVHEHVLIGDSLEAIENWYNGGDFAALISEVKRFVELLNNHFIEEENVLMPGLSRKLSQQELESLIAETHRMEAEKKKSDLWALFERDHKRIDGNISRLRETIGKSNDDNNLYSRIKSQLLKHIELEETILFPAFQDRAAQGLTGPVQVMIAEHREITSLISSAADPIDKGTQKSRVEALVGKLAVHNKKEELILYPLINRTLLRADRAAVFNECFHMLAAA